MPSSLQKQCCTNNLEELNATVGRLAEAQERTEEKVAQLAEGQASLAAAQGRTEFQLVELTKAQARTEHQVCELVQVVQSLTVTAVALVACEFISAEWLA